MLQLVLWETTPYTCSRKVVVSYKDNECSVPKTTLRAEAGSQHNRVMSPSTIHCEHASGVCSNTTDMKLYTKDGIPVNWNEKFWHTYFEMMKMTFQDMDDDDEIWDVACGRIKAEYLVTDEGKQKLAKIERKIRKRS